MEAAGSSVAAPTNDWPLTDAQSNCPGTTPATATDTVTGTAATIAGTYTWTCDNTFDTDLSLTAPGSDVVPPAGTIPVNQTQLSLSLWFKTSTAGAVLASAGAQPVSASTTTGGYDPILYIGSDGRLNGEWYDGTTSPIASASPVSDGLWHHTVITACNGRQTLFLDGQPQATIAGTPDLSFGSTATATNPTFGAGYLGGSWPDQRYYGLSTATAEYYTGQLAAITLSTPATCNLPSPPPPGSTFRGSPVVVPVDAGGLTSGGFSAFAISATGQLETARQSAPGSTWSSWASLGGNLQGTPVVVPADSGGLTSGGLAAFAISTTGQLQIAWQSPPGSPWSTWTNLEG